MISKIQLSPEEMALVNNTEWILTKHIIFERVFQMLGELNEVYKKEAELYQNLFRLNFKNINGKISRGENYQSLPYAILDYPSSFEKENIFAVRTMFWWGNFFSITLHLSGEHTEKFTRNSTHLFSILQKNNFFICVNEDEWQHHFDANNYLPATEIDLFQFKKILEKDFFKISKKIALTEWENANKFLLDSFIEIMQLLNINYPTGKKDLLPESPITGSGL